MDLDRSRAGRTWDAADYERGRPGYPPELVELLTAELPVRPGTRVCDLAAGTGKLSRVLAAVGAEVVAVEPAPEMRRVLAATCPGVEVLEGTAEHLPLEDCSVDAVTVAQAFHWFDPALALTEIHRVLPPGGGLALVWNLRDETEDWVRELGAVVRRYSGGKPKGARQRQAWDAVITGTGDFTEVRTARFRNIVAHDADTLLARVASTSHVSALSSRRRARCLRAVRGLIDRHPDLAGRDVFELPHELVA